MKSAVLMLVIGYLSICALLYFGQRAFLYFPTAGSKVLGVEPVLFKNDGVELNGWVVNPGRDRALLYYGGNAEQVEQNISFFTARFQQYSIYLLPYRGYGSSTGSPTEAGLYSDALYVYDELAKLHPKISLMGRSLGTGIATYVAALRDIDRLILVTPYDSIENVARDVYWMFPVSLLIKDKYNSLERVEHINAKTLILIAEHDEVIARKHSENLLVAFQKSDVESAIINGAGHNDISEYQKYSVLLQDFLK